jgi:2'-5' RNA ligase
VREDRVVTPDSFLAWFSGSFPRLSCLEIEQGSPTESPPKIAPFMVSLGEFRIFQHSSRKATLWLAPEPKEALVQLQTLLQAICSGCDDLSRFPAGFTPHLSVGQAGSAEEARRLQKDLQEGWTALGFEVSSVAVLRRGQDTPFEIDCRVPLAGGCARGAGEG